MTSPPDLLSELRSGRQGALDQLIPLVYQELRGIAHRQLAVGGRGGSLSTTPLAHGAYLQPVAQSRAAVSPFNQTRNICNYERAEISQVDDAEIWFQRSKRIVRDLRLRRRDG